MYCVSAEEVVKRAAGEAEAGVQRGERGQGHEKNLGQGVDLDTGRVYLSHEVGNVFGFSTRSDTNLSVQSWEKARSLKFWIKELEALLYLCGENKGADQLYCTADLWAVFAFVKNCFSHVHPGLPVTGNSEVRGTRR